MMSLAVLARPVATTPLAILARSLLGDGVAVEGGAVADWSGPLHPEEATLIARAVPHRRSEFAAGRTAARAAMEALGHPPKVLTRGPGGPPVWPDGLTGTITHGGAHVLAAVAATSDAAALGLDLEPMAVLAPDIGARICGPGENRSRALEVFGAKEAAYKAQFMLSGRVLGFEALRIEFVADGGFVAHFRVAAAPFVPGDRLTGQQASWQGLLISALRIGARKDAWS